MENLQQQDKSDKSTEEKFMLVKEKKQCNLREYVNIHKNFKIRQENILDLTKGILRNLQLVHSQNKIYYDLKLENIHVIYNDEQELMKSEIIQVVLNGFDKSKIMENEEVFIKKTSTLAYQSPQILNGNGNYTNKVDSWAFGLVMFELYTKQDYSVYFQNNPDKALTDAGVREIRDYLILRLRKKLKNNSQYLQ